ncbi:MAG: 3-deoxy-D-manno-octulosonate 8-phosphate phosphatase [Sphingomonadales bacterium]|nr:3-deoxy-D-manno-octulosonate 8-phosphate phosphatase [Sphingomonadales bacterium]
MSDPVRSRLKNIRVAVFDLDGVLTDGQVYVMGDGQELRSMHVRDGYALARASEAGLPIWVISGAHPPGVRQRLNQLGVQEISLGIRDKAAEWNRLQKKYAIDPTHILFMGDDLPDLPLMRLAGLATCPKDAAPEILAAAQYIIPLAGGEGCVRYILEEWLRLLGLWDVPSLQPGN